MLQFNVDPLTLPVLFPNNLLHSYSIRGIPYNLMFHSNLSSVYITCMQKLGSKLQACYAPTLLVCLSPIIQGSLEVVCGVSCQGDFASDNESATGQY